MSGPGADDFAKALSAIDDAAKRVVRARGAESKSIELLEAALAELARVANDRRPEDTDGADDEPPSGGGTASDAAAAMCELAQGGFNDSPFDPASLEDELRIARRAARLKQAHRLEMSAAATRAGVELLNAEDARRSLPPLKATDISSTWLAAERKAAEHVAHAARVRELDAAVDVAKRAAHDLWSVLEVATADEESANARVLFAEHAIEMFRDSRRRGGDR